MKIFLIIYGILVLACFVFFEVISAIDCADRNRAFITNIVRPNHLGILMYAVFFPFTLLIVICSLIADAIIKR